MIVLVAKYYVKIEQGDAVQAALVEMADLVHQHEPGCLLYQVCRSRENADFFLLYEQYRDEAAVDFHRHTPHFQQYIVETVIPMLDKREVAFYDLVIA